ncbi:MAG: tripartite tricarboxylate transporter substrate binding protein [Burkholderiaceae bacterium]|nr:tripartite tricarboxylate transporter substrate binding protein [Burkholderiaceae bacterium]
MEPILTLPGIRRLLGAGLAAIALLPALSAHAQDWPTRPITLYLGFPAGSGVDVVARRLQEPLGKQLGQPVVIDYKPGAAGNIASQFVAGAKADGYTLLFGTAATHGSNAALYKKLPFDVETDFVPVAPLLDVSNVLTINPDVINVRTLQEFVALVKANPGKYNYASTGNGAGTHMAFAEFNARLGLDMVHVPYKGGPEAIQAVLKGDTCCIMNQVQTVLSHYKAGKVRLLGVTTAAPVAAVKEVPTIASSGLPGTQGFDSSIWFAIFAPKGTDARIVDKLNAAVKVVLEQREVQAHFEAQGNAVRIESPDQFRRTVRDNRVKWAEVARSANITLD